MNPAEPAPLETANGDDDARALPSVEPSRGPGPSASRAPSQPARVDRSIAKMIAYKRIVTGAISLVLAVVMVAIGVAKHNTPPMLGLAVAIFLAGGGWTLRDGIRLKRELSATAR